MAGKLKLDVAVPERLMLSEEVEEVQVPGADGYLGILPDHAPLMTQLGSGALSYKTAGQTRYMALTGGVMEVLPDHVRVHQKSGRVAPPRQRHAAKSQTTEDRRRAGHSGDPASRGATRSHQAPSGRLA